MHFIYNILSHALKVNTLWLLNCFGFITVGVNAIYANSNSRLANANCCQAFRRSRAPPELLVVIDSSLKMEFALTNNVT